VNRFRSLLNIWTDPLLVKEMRTRMRARVVVTVEMLYVGGILGLVGLSLIFVRCMEDTTGWELGASLFKMITYIQALMMFFVTPLVAASAVSGEREQKTFDSLLATPTTPRHIAWTKLTAALSCFGVLILASLPFTCASFILGGVSPADVAGAYLFTFVSTGLAGAMGLYWSCRFERSIASIPAAAVNSGAIMLVCSILSDACRALSLVSPTAFLQALFSGEEVGWFADRLAPWIPSFLFSALIFACFITAAIGRLQFPSERRFVSFRALVLGLVVSLIVFFTADQMTPTQTAAEAREKIYALFCAILAVLSLMAPWIGANRPVLESERGVRARPPGLMRLLGWAMTAPAPYLTLIGVLAFPAVMVGIEGVGPSNLHRAVPLGGYFGVIGFSTLCWAQFARLLGDRETPRGRYVGLAVAYVVTALVVLLPFGLLMWGASHGDRILPAPAQLLALLSPLTALQAIGDPHAVSKTLPLVADALGKAGPVGLVTAGYAVATALLTFVIALRDRRRKA
jgi:ABC-type transport system involved in multi-copper enzyme maturation permease subunit